MTAPSDLIAAIATAHGRAGIGVVRVSGRALGRFAEQLVGSVPPPRLATRAAFRDVHGAAIDDGLALYFPAPHSYTGEDVLELQGHGGPVVLQMLLRRCFELGARLAEPGEFTRRAFLNDKLDLAQAEAVADLIDAATATAASCAVRSLQGEFSAAIGAPLASRKTARVAHRGGGTPPVSRATRGARALPETRTTAIPARPAPVAIAAMVSAGPAIRFRARASALGGGRLGAFDHAGDLPLLRDREDVVH